MTARGMGTYYLGAFMLAALLIGGGTDKGLPTTMVLELLALPLLFLIHPERPDGSPAFQWPIVVLCAFVAFIFCLQLLPAVAPTIPNIAPGADLPHPFALSGDVGRTIDSLAFTATALVAFLALCSRSTEERNTILRFLSIGFVLNMVLALIQFAATQAIDMTFAGYPMHAGIFANENHFSSLLYVSIPFWVYLFDSGMRRYLALLPVAGILFVEFADGSTAGILIGLGAALVSFAFVWNVGPIAKIAAISPVLIGLGLFLVHLPDEVTQSFVGPLARETFAQTTLTAIRANLPLGSGFGSFPIVYPHFVPTSDIFVEFINHAHDDFLELVLEGGLPALAGLLFYAVLFVRAALRHDRTPMRWASLLAVIFILIHSAVDYPLRTYALSMLFAFANANLLAAPDRTWRNAERRAPLASEIVAAPITEPAAP